MKFLRPVRFITLLFMGPLVMHAQDRTPVKYGKISPSDFALTGAKFDSSAEAVVIADVGQSQFVGNNKGWFSIEFKRYKRIKILKKEGFDAGTVQISLYQSGNTVETLQGLKAITYNLVNGKVEETRLDDKAVFTDKLSQNWVQKKFTFPALREGSIIEYSYTQSSDFLQNLQPWSFQGGYPCLWSEYEVDIPRFFNYVTLGQGFLPYSINTTDSRTTQFRIRFPGGASSDESGSLEDDVIDRRWVIKDVPALKEEGYTTTLRNYISKIEFNLASINLKNSMPQDRMGSWISLGQGLMKSDEFGSSLNSSNGWLSDEMKVITKGANTKREKAEKIYAFIRDNFTCTAHERLMTDNSLKTIYKNKNGSEAEINLLLAAMLNHEHIPSDPVILSTRSNGFTHEIYPLLSRFNYVICRTTIDSAVVLLDASDPWLGFGRLPSRCYNGHARVITSEAAYPIYLDADSLSESKFTIATITNVKAGEMAGNIKSRLGYFESCTAREKMHEKGDNEYFKTIRSAYTGDMEVTAVSADTPNIKENALTMNVEFDFKPGGDKELIYFNPMMNEAYKENPFKAGNRFYPVEMPYAMDESFTLYLDIPEGYEIDELPKSAKVAFNSDEGFFEYLIGKSSDAVQFRCRIKLTKATFKQEDYATLREFFGFIVKKQSEQIVFKKKK